MLVVHVQVDDFLFISSRKIFFSPVKRRAQLSVSICSKSSSLPAFESARYTACESTGRSEIDSEIDHFRYGSGGEPSVFFCARTRRALPSSFFRARAFFLDRIKSMTHFALFSRTSGLRLGHRSDRWTNAVVWYVARSIDVRMNEGRTGLVH